MRWIAGGTAKAISRTTRRSTARKWRATWCVCSTTKKPVLAHLFLNYMLDNGVGYKNFVDFNGYQPPLNEIQPESLISKGVIPETLASSVLTERDFGPKSLVEAGLTNAGESLCQPSMNGSTIASMRSPRPPGETMQIPLMIDPH